MSFVDDYFDYQREACKKYGPDKTIVFIQKGDFYESYQTIDKGYNLLELSNLLNIILSKSDKSKETSIKNPKMLGFPLISLQKNLHVLTNNNYTVTIIDQIKNDTNDVIGRHITGVYSPGTYSEGTYNNDSSYLLSLYIEKEKQLNGKELYGFGISAIDLSTGKNVVYEIHSNPNDEYYILNETLRFINIYNPREIIISSKDNIDLDEIMLYLELGTKKCIINKNINKTFFKISYQTEYLNKVFSNYNFGMLSSIEYFNLERNPYLVISYIILLEFSTDHCSNIISNLCQPEKLNLENNLILGNNATYQLNILQDCILETKTRQFQSLFDVVNKTSTAIGKRFLKETILNPIINTDILNDRYNKIEQFMENNIYLEIEKYLINIADIERLHRKMSLNTLHPQEFVTLISSYNNINLLIDYINENKFQFQFNKNELNEYIDDYTNIFNIDEMSKYNLNQIENSFLLKGVNKDIDDIQNKLNNNSTFLEKSRLELEKYIVNDKKTSNPNKIKLNYNNRDGYYFELTKIRGNKLKDELKAKEKIKIGNKSIPYDNFEFKEQRKGPTKLTFLEMNNVAKKQIILQLQLKTTCKDAYLEIINNYYIKYNTLFANMTDFIKNIDFIKSGAKLAKLYGYCKPIISESDHGFISTKELRHPIVERIQLDTEYIPNDIELNKTGMILYGLNSSGKTVLMKAVGLSIVMAQSGLFVPAKTFTYSPYTSLYARITGNDNLFKGLSSFALEMTELRAILKSKGNKTLVIGDEICRGTEQTSAISIVATTIITLSELETSFIFASHIHELASLDEIIELENVDCYHLKVDFDEINDCLIFNRKLEKGSGPSVYGLTVAKYLLHDDKFFKLAESIKNKISGKNINTAKPSKYNSNLFVYECKICKNTTKQLDTHHINFQKDCSENFIIGKEHIHKNTKCNLVVLCKDCHNKVHSNTIIIDGYKDTSKGVVLKYKIKKLKK
jgi:DNA mismatch repair protein MutS